MLYKCSLFEPRQDRVAGHYTLSSYRDGLFDDKHAAVGCDDYLIPGGSISIGLNRPILLNYSQRKYTFQRSCHNNMMSQSC